VACSAVRPRTCPMCSAISTVRTPRELRTGAAAWHVCVSGRLAVGEHSDPSTGCGQRAQLGLGRGTRYGAPSPAHPRNANMHAYSSLSFPCSATAVPGHEVIKRQPAIVGASHRPRHARLIHYRSSGIRQQRKMSRSLRRSPPQAAALAGEVHSSVTRTALYRYLSTT
jgi:hypothetical protein